MFEDCKILELPKIKDSRGNLSYVENSRLIPFDIKRVYYLYDVPGGSERGGHAHKKLQQLVIAVAGSFEIVLNDGINNRVIRLDRAYQGLYVCPMIWRELQNFSSGAVCLVLASEFYDEADYYRDYSKFAIDAAKQREEA